MTGASDFSIAELGRAAVAVVISVKHRYER